MKLTKLINLWLPFGGGASTALPANLPTAIRSRLLASVPGVAGVYHTQTPTRPARPYIIMFELMTAPIIGNVDSVHGSKTIQFSCVSDDDMEAETIGRSAIAALSLPTRLTFTGGRHLSGWVGTESKIIDQGSPGSFGQAFRFNFDYTFLIQW